ncbi:RepB family plasmid replication initiator protein [Photobacterium toruni]|uniref:Replication initiation protein n=1 Tax=Photobacterium toruni TaxID=1935446 RepID=A0A1T4UJB6_9GAMM|nr:RepB family plasmid replication initiator protein [Photobacterium toruni]SKA52779.1 Replication initiation protein [Photobacterium toruni]
MEREITIKKNSIIYVSNKLLDAIFKMSLSEKRVMWYVLKDYKFNDLSTVSLDGTIKHNVYAKLYNISIQQASKEVRQACLSLPDNSFFVPRPEWDGNILEELDQQIYTKSELNELKAFSKGNVVDVCDYGCRKGESDVYFTRSFLLHAIPVKNYFTQYRLYEADSLTNANHIALYEELQRWIDTKEGEGIYITTPIRLINKLQLPKTYESYPQMRRGFITPAMSNINENTDLNVNVEEVRADPKNKRSKVIKLYFHYSKKKKSELVALEA